MNYNERNSQDVFEIIEDINDFRCFSSSVTEESNKPKLITETKTGKIDKNEGKNEIMSLVGIINCSDGILVFGDKKASRQVGNIICEDKSRGAIKKIFENDKMIVATFGANEVGNFYFIENAITEILNNNFSVLEFAKAFESYLKGTNGKTFNIILCEKKNDNKIYHLIFEAESIKKILVYSFELYGGNNNYISIFKSFFEKLKEYKNSKGFYNLKIKEMRRKIDNILSHATSLYDEILEYNSVSKEIDFIEYIY